MPSFYPFPVLSNVSSTLLSWAPQLRAVSDRATWLGEEFSWQSYQPGISGGGTMTTTPSDLRGFYIKIGEIVFVNIRAVFTTAVAANPVVYLTLPLTTGKNGDMNTLMAAVVDGGNVAGFALGASGASRVEVYRYDGANWGLGANRAIRILGAYTTI